MREIKFRGKSEEPENKGEWIIGGIAISVPMYRICRDEGGWYDGPFCYEYAVEENTIGQSTGLLDKNGAEIYEGDIISFDGNMTADNSFGIEPNGFIYDETSIHSIVWEDESIGFRLNWANDETKKYKNSTMVLLIDGACEIIGNIYDNPELLEAK